MEQKEEGGECESAVKAAFWCSILFNISVFVCFVVPLSLLPFSP